MTELDKLKQLIEFFEGYSGKLYRCPRGKLTIGFGYNIEDNGLPRDICEELLRRVLEDISKWCEKQFPWWNRLDKPRQHALISMAYQLGKGGLLGFRKMLKAISEGDWERAYWEALDSAWARQTPKRAMRTARVLRYGKEEYFFKE